MNKNDIITFLNVKSSFTKGGIFDYFEEIDIKESIVIYLSVNDNDITININNDCVKTVSFIEFIKLYNNSELNNICD